MITIAEQEELLIAIGKELPKKIEVYAIGGTAMMLQNLKNTTLEIDLVCEKEKDRNALFETISRLEGKQTDVTLVYGLQKHAPRMMSWGNCRFDIFTPNVISSTFSEGMKERAQKTHEFANLIIRVASQEDIFVMKSATNRIKDLEDMISLAQQKKLDWKVILEESKTQVKLGNERAIMNLGEKIEKLQEAKIAEIPKGMINELWKLFKKQVNEDAF
jgi:hypothetical protein